MPVLGYKKIGMVYERMPNHFKCTPVNGNGEAMSDTTVSCQCNHLTDFAITMKKRKANVKYIFKAIRCLQSSLDSSVYVGYDLCFLRVMHNHMRFGTFTLVEDLKWELEAS